MAMVTYILLTALALCSLSAAAPEWMPQPSSEENNRDLHPGGSRQSTTSQQSEDDLDELLHRLHLQRVSETAGGQNLEGHLDTQPQSIQMDSATKSSATVAQIDPTEPVDPLTCGASYHDALNEVMRIKEECDDAAFYDCSQPLTIISTLLNGTYELSAPCESEGPFSTANKLLARCDMETDGGGWLVIQRRANNTSVDFMRNYEDYERGFGDLDSEFWYGLKTINCLTTRDEVELRIDLEDESGDNQITWVYQLFRVAGPDDRYRLTIGQGEGTPGSFDSMALHNRQRFTTFDQDNDRAGNRNCADNNGGGWWYGGDVRNTCAHSNLNGDHGGSGNERPTWYDGSNRIYYPYIEMKIRRKN